MMATSAPEAPHKESVYGSDEVYQIICDLCIQDTQSVEAKAFCSVCMQYLCTACHKSHTRANASKMHKILTGKDMPACQRSKLRLKPTCSKHPDKLLENLCYDHKSACCAKCKILDHRYCKNVIKLSELSLKTNCKEENELKVESLNVILNEFIRLKTVSETMKSNLEADRKEMIKKIKESRKGIDDKLDRLEADMLTKVDKEIDTGFVDLEKQKNEINCFIDELKKQVNEYKDTLKPESGDQVIAMSTMMESEIQKYNTILNELQGSFYKTDISLSLDDKLQDIICHISSLGEFEIVKAKVEVQRPYEERQAVYLREVDINLPSDQTETKISAIETLPDEKLLLCDASNLKIKLFDSSYKALSEIKLTSEPRGMALMTPTHVIVNLSNEKCLQNIKINQDNTLTLKGRQQTELHYSRLLKYERDIAICWTDSFHYYFDIIDTSGHLIRRIRKEPLLGGIFSNIHLLCMSPDNSIIYISDSENGCIAFSLNGDVIFRFTDEMMKFYFGVCKLPMGFMCITGMESENIVMMNSNGEKVKELVRLKGLKPAHITYSMENNIMLVKVAKESVLKVFSLI